MANFVLVHPAWFGGWCWKKLVPVLKAAGHEVFTPTLSGLGERVHLARPEIGLQAHVEDVLNVLAFEDLSDIVLLGTSSAGMVVTGVAERAPERIAELVYVDAFVPEDGQALFDLVPAERRPAMEAMIAEEGHGWLLPRFTGAAWSEFVPTAWQVTDQADLRWLLPKLVPTPAGHFREPIQRVNASAEKVPRSYIRCTRWPNPTFDRYAQTAARSEGWRHFELATSHLPYVTHPRELAELLLAIAGGPAARSA